MGVKKCIACRKDIEAGAKFCDKCGSPQACKCGNTNIEGGSYCTKCGAYMESRRSPSSAPARPSGRGYCYYCKKFSEGPIMTNCLGGNPRVRCKKCGDLIDLWP